MCPRALMASHHTPAAVGGKGEERRAKDVADAKPGAGFFADFACFARCSLAESRGQDSIPIPMPIPTPRGSLRPQDRIGQPHAVGGNLLEGVGEGAVLNAVVVKKGSFAAFGDEDEGHIPS